MDILACGAVAGGYIKMQAMGIARNEHYNDGAGIFVLHGAWCLGG